ncbi:DUF4304 domain-containing protein [Bacillus sp. FJAT-27251]|uniref:DUF4304 domain-containing protein n=1 Tax=Bacillus sp. FJAT-27251 TaxID=1684142 RepID=UPI0006A7BCA9|nr:DUF4304 domain-containing protein [Bacillus sp. FJAT-27251]
MAAERDKMISELKKIVVPELRMSGFKGSFPHFRRIKKDKIDLMTYPIDDGQWFRYDGENVSENRYQSVAAEVLDHLYQAEEYWEHENYIS